MALLFLATPGWAPPARAFELFRNSDGSLNTISPAFTDPVEVVLWVHPNVSADDEAWVTGEIEAGLDMWENVPTSSVRFTTTTMRQETQPSVPGKLLVQVGNEADLTSGAASPPGLGGVPGWWAGATADAPHTTGFRAVAAHEIGHAIGISHSTVGYNEFGANNIPVMHWSRQGGATALTEDDVAAVSTAYPEPGQPLSATTGTIRGMVFNPAAPGKAIDGVNVVAVNHSTGEPVVGRLTGAQGLTSVPGGGSFELVGLPPGTYDLRYLDGTSFAGSIYGYYDRKVQTDNFQPYTSGPWTVSAGQEINFLGSALQGGVEPISVDNIGVGDRDHKSGIDPSNDTLPPAIAGQPYDVWLRLRGGVRPLELGGVGTNPGLGLSVDLVDTQDLNADPRGRAWLHISGTPTRSEAVGTTVIVDDEHGATGTVSFHTSPAIVDISGSTLRYYAPAGQVNDVSVDQLVGGTFRVRDLKAPLQALAPCSQVSWKEVTCPAAGIDKVEVVTTDRNDAIDISGGTKTTVLAGSGNDTISGGAGPDVFDGGTGSDSFQGRGGTDWVYYTSRTSRVVADIDGVGDDGEFGEGDNIGSDVEAIWGGSANDKLTGDTKANILVGGAGPDELVGGDGGDLLVDGIWIFGGNDADVLKGGPGQDALLAGLGNDTLIGGPDKDVLNGAAGNDTIDSRDTTAETAVCGDGADTALIDLLDTTSECESVNAPNLLVLTDNGVLRYTELDSHDADLTVTRVGSVYLLNNPGAVPSAGPGCLYVFGFVACDGAANGGDGVAITRLNIDAGDGADFVDTSATSTDSIIYGGSGDDVLVGSGGQDILDGGADDDWVAGRDGASTLRGGTGADLLFGGAANDTIEGGPGNDTLTDGGGYDTIRGEADNDAVYLDDSSVGADVDGGLGHDSLLGGGADDTIEGGYGDDWIWGGGGNDALHGGEDDDHVYADGFGDDLSSGASISGGAGNDVLVGSSYSDDIFGDSGDDLIGGNGGTDTLVGFSGDDEIDSRDSNPEQVDCGPGNDTATVDLFDLPVSCETVDAPQQVDALVYTFGGSLRYRAAPGDVNQVSVYTTETPTGEIQKVEDATSPVSVGPGCTLVDGAAWCDGIVNSGDGIPVQFVNVDVGDQDDWVVADTSVGARIYGGLGDDILVAGSAIAISDWVEGGPGADVMMSGAGSDVIVGQDGENDGLIHCGGDADSDVVLLDPLPLDANLSQCGSSSIFR